MSNTASRCRPSTHRLQLPSERPHPAEDGLLGGVQLLPEGLALLPGNLVGMMHLHTVELLLLSDKALGRDTQPTA